MNRVSAGVIVVGVAGLLAGGCANHHKDGAMGQARPKPVAETAGFDPKDPVTASATRERALALIEEAAQSPEAQSRANAMEAALLAPERLGAVISHGLSDRNPGVRSVAAMAVGRDQLIKLLDQVRVLEQDENPLVKCAVIFALARCGEPVDRTPLATMLLKDKSVHFRSQAAMVLGDMGDESAIPLLSASIRDKVPGASPVQSRIFELQVAEAMVKLGDEAQRPAIQAALHPSHSDDLEVAALAAQVIGETQDREAAAQLVSLADYRDKKGNTYPAEVRLAAAASLSMLGIRGNAATLIADQYSTDKAAPIRAQAAYVYGQTALPENWGKLDAMMGDSDSSVRVSAAAAILRSMSHAVPN